jgi:hypothetical protein
MFNGLGFESTENRKDVENYKLTNLATYLLSSNDFKTLPCFVIWNALSGFTP